MITADVRGKEKGRGEPKKGGGFGQAQSHGRSCTAATNQPRGKYVNFINYTFFRCARRGHHTMGGRDFPFLLHQTDSVWSVLDFEFSKKPSFKFERRVAAVATIAPPGSSL